MSTIIRLHRYGGPEELSVESQEPLTPGPGEVLIRQTAVGLDYVDVYHRTGQYPLVLPSSLGVAAAGVVEAAGRGSAFVPGEAVAYAGPPAGSYAGHRVMSAERLVRLPATVSDAVAAAWMLRGLTAYMLLTRVHVPRPGETLLVQAAAGGLGQVLCGWGRRLGMTVIGTVGSAAKRAAAEAAGAHHVLVMEEGDFVDGVRGLTGGAGADFSVDGIGGAVLERTLEATAPFGHVASVGQAAGGAETISLAAIGPRRSLALSRPSVFAYGADLARYRPAAEQVVAMMAEGLFPAPTAEYALTEAARAHADLEGRRLTGAAILRP